jgi:hypothetical protein
MMRSKKAALAAIAAALVTLLAACSNFSTNAEAINPSKSSNTPSGVNLAKGCTVTASTVQPGNPETNLVDGDLSTQWSTNESGDGWFTVDLGGVKQISMTKLHPSYANNGTLSYTLERSDDGTTWVKVKDSPSYDVKTPASECDPLILDGFNVSCRYLKVSASAANWPGWIAAYEFEVYN